VNLRSLQISLGSTKIGVLFQYGTGSTAITRFLPDANYWRQADPPVLSAAALVAPQSRELFWSKPQGQPFFNGLGQTLPTWFQNLLPEGALRRHLVELRGCAPDDQFELLAACGSDLPGNVHAKGAQLSKGEIALIVTQGHDALEFTVTAHPEADATSLSGIQPKLALVEFGGRYVARSKNKDGVHIIAKLPTVDFALLPEVEALSLQMARAAGVDAAIATLAPLSAITEVIPFVLGASSDFLAVRRFDRLPMGKRIHCEDFAQILQIHPDDKYTNPNANYSRIAQVMQGVLGMGDDAVYELLRRIAVNDLLGNFDAHVKNFGVLYADGHRATLSPAYDVVAYSAYLSGRGHALRFSAKGATKQAMGPAVVREFCNATGLLETMAGKVVKDVVAAAVSNWPAMIANSGLLHKQKANLMTHFKSRPIVKPLLKHLP
jgi:serine/threonine-protein kinase HipA